MVARIGLGLVALAALGLGLAQAVSAQDPWPFTPSRTVNLELLGGGTARLVEADRLFRTISTAETNGRQITANSNRRLYVIDDPAYDVVDAACLPNHGEATVVPLARQVAGSYVVVNAIAVEGSSAVCTALGLKVR